MADPLYQPSSEVSPRVRTAFSDVRRRLLPSIIPQQYAKAKAALGDKFDVRRFHNAVLDDGALPLTVLEARIDEWIVREKTR